MCVKMAESEQGTLSSTPSSGNVSESLTSSTCPTDSEGTDSGGVSLLQCLRPPLPSKLVRKCVKLQTCCFTHVFLISYI